MAIFASSLDLGGRSHSLLHLWIFTDRHDALAFLGPAPARGGVARRAADVRCHPRSGRARPRRVGGRPRRSCPRPTRRAPDPAREREQPAERERIVDVAAPLGFERPRAASATRTTAS